MSVDQPNTQNLDNMLRPSAPKLGEPLMTRLPWPESLSLPSGNGALSSHIGNGSIMPQQLPSNESKALRGNSNSPGREFHTLASFGLDNVLRDVMDDMTFEGTSINNHPSFNPDMTGMDAVQTTQPLPTTSSKVPPLNSTADPVNGVPRTTFGDSMFSNPSMDFTTTSPTLDSNGLQSDSPLLDGGNMNWTLWDDMVNQYGLEGQPNNQANPPNPNGTGHVGILNWF